jgi:hypothetical protein
MSERHFFRARGGRVYHESDTPIPGRGSAVRAVCGATFVRFLAVEYTAVPTCRKCCKVLADREALQPIADALIAEYGE